MCARAVRQGSAGDPPPSPSRTTAVRGTRLPSEAQALSEAIVDHVAEVCYRGGGGINSSLCVDCQVSFQKYRIARMVLNFKARAA